MTTTHKNARALIEDRLAEALAFDLPDDLPFNRLSWYVDIGLGLGLVGDVCVTMFAFRPDSSRLATFPSLSFDDALAADYRETYREMVVQAAEAMRDLWTRRDEESEQAVRSST